jgi:hypothetical protein
LSRWVAPWLALGLLAGCSSAIGDACTTDQECGGRTCLSTSVFKGGYCTEHCVLGNSGNCPTGAQCVKHGGDTLCLRECADDTECRSGYACQPYRGQGNYCLTPGDQ